MKLNALKTQIKFRKKVLKSSVEDKTLLQFSSNGIPFNLVELISHLETLISSHSSTNETENLI